MLESARKSRLHQLFSSVLCINATCAVMFVGSGGRIGRSEVGGSWVGLVKWFLVE